jgi:putative colanic acid biosynthesis UDP-glucose lipid carrier transferase
MSQNGFVKDNANQFSGLYRFLDFILIIFLLLSCKQIYSVSFSDTYVVLGLLASISFFLSAESLQLYRSWRTDFTPRLALYTLISWAGGVFCVVTYLFFSKTSVDISRVVIGFWFLSTAISLVSWRLLFRLFIFNRRRNGYNTRSVAIFGLSDSGVRLANEFIDHPETGFTLKGFFDDREAQRLPEAHQKKLQGNVDLGVQLARSGEFDVVYIALPLAAQKRIEEILRELGDTTVDVHLVPDFFTFNLINARLSNVGSTQTISVYESPMSGLASVTKRLEDVIIGALILLAIVIPMLVIAVLIKLDSRGPVFFKQKRYGLDGKAIEVWKFRSMTVADNGAFVKQATKGDARITKFGALLRKTSLDELPQFINVLQGNMSIVGPRPHAIAHNEEYRKLVDFYMLRHKVKPGITGWAQINGWRGETDTLEKMEKRIEFDLEYIRSWSIILDIKIIFTTIFKGFINKNAY